MGGPKRNQKYSVAEVARVLLAVACVVALEAEDGEEGMVGIVVVVVDSVEGSAVVHEEVEAVASEADLTTIVVGLATTTVAVSGEEVIVALREEGLEAPPTGKDAAWGTGFPRKEDLGDHPHRALVDHRAARLAVVG